MISTETTQVFFEVVERSKVIESREIFVLAFF
jgi:hypothetical protein